MHGLLRIREEELTTSWMMRLCFLLVTAFSRVVGEISCLPMGTESLITHATPLVFSESFLLNVDVKLCHSVITNPDRVAAMYDLRVVFRFSVRLQTLKFKSIKS